MALRRCLTCHLSPLLRVSSLPNWPVHSFSKAVNASHTLGQCHELLAPAIPPAAAGQGLCPGPCGIHLHVYLL